MKEVVVQFTIVIEDEFSVHNPLSSIYAPSLKINSDEKLKLFVHDFVRNQIEEGIYDQKERWFGEEFTFGIKDLTVK